MNECIECYATDPTATPILGKKDCLENHEQYICGTCGRCICCQKDPIRQLRRIDFPFKSVEIAKLYLRVADQLQQAPCGIYEIISQTGRKSFKIFVNDQAYADYLSKNKKKTTNHNQALFRHGKYQGFPKTEIRKLNQPEVDAYLTASESNNQ